MTNREFKIRLGEEEKGENVSKRWLHGLRNKIRFENECLCISLNA
jgi:hypothetical protein